MAQLFLKFKRFILLFGDTIILYFSLWLVLILRYGYGPALFAFRQHLEPFTITYIIWLIIFYVFGIYEPASIRRIVNFYSLFLKAMAINALVSIAFFYFVPYFGVTPKTNLFLTIAVFSILFFIWRRIFISFIDKFLIIAEKIIIIGKTPQSISLAKKINKNFYLGYKLSYFLDVKDKKISKLKEEIKKKQINTVVFAVNLFKHPNLQRIFYQCLPVVNIKDFPEFYEELTGKIPVDEIDRIWFLSNLKEENKKIYEGIKRIIDILFSLILGLLTGLVSPFVALAIKIEDGGPVFYKQKRVGKNGKLFDLIKFRSMKEGAEKQKAHWATKKDPRITKVGKLLRKTSIDELPQFINILKGEMSTIGPRPERPEFLEILTKKIPFYQIRHLVKPGLTGWAQINFPYGDSTKDALEKLQYELYYIKNRSLVLDFRIILKTIGLYLKGERGKLAH
jgi:exopolysaccharide biosynthesis polyprenyl glycosylphosphotransferase